MNSIPSMTKQGEFKARLQGIISGTAAANSLTVFDYLLPYDRYMNGAQYHANNYNHGDHITFQIVHPQLGVVDEFASVWYVQQMDTIILYRARLYKDLIIRVKYQNIGANDVHFCVNMFLHEAV